MGDGVGAFGIGFAPNFTCLVGDREERRIGDLPAFVHGECPQKGARFEGCPRIVKRIHARIAFDGGNFGIGKRIFGEAHHGVDLRREGVLEGVAFVEGKFPSVGKVENELIGGYHVGAEVFGRIGGMGDDKIFSRGKRVGIGGIALVIRDGKIPRSRGSGVAFDGFERVSPVKGDRFLGEVG